MAMATTAPALALAIWRAKTMNTGRSPGDDEDEDEDDEDQSPDVSDSIHEIETFERVPIDEAEAEAEAETESKDDADRPQGPIAEFQYEPYPIAENGPPVCPLCGQQLSMVQIHEPGRAVVSPCGCRLPPDPFFNSSGE